MKLLHYIYQATSVLNFLFSDCHFREIPVPCLELSIDFLLAYTVRVRLFVCFFVCSLDF